MVEHNDVITVTNEAQKVLLDNELKGQLSDGYWENARPFDHWKMPCRAAVVIGDTPSVNFYAMRRYNFAADELLKVVRTRMILYVRLAKLLGAEQAKQAECLFKTIDGDANACDRPKFIGIPKWMIAACNYEGDSGERYRARKVQLEALIEKHGDAFLNEVSLPIKDKKASYNLSMLNKDLEGIKAAFANYIR